MAISRSQRKIVVTGAAGGMGLSRNLAREFGSEDITVNVIAPGVTITKAAKKILPREVQEQGIEDRCIRREHVSADLVGTTLFLASPDSDFVTG